MGTGGLKVFSFFIEFGDHDPDGENNDSSTPLCWFACLLRSARHSKGNSISISQLECECCGAGFPQELFIDIRSLVY